MRRLLVPSAALWWGLQFALLNPALALVLVGLFDATAAEVGLVLAVYNAGGFVASLVVPGWADRRGDYLRPMLACAVLTLALAAVLALSTTLPMAVVALVVLGGPAGVGSSLLFAHLHASGAGTAQVANTRAVVSFAWVAGPPLATVLIGWSGSRAVLAAIAVVAVLNCATTAAMLTSHAAHAAPARSGPADDAGASMSRVGVAVVVAAFVALQATNTAVIAVLGLFVTRTLGADVVWSGAALGLAAALEIPALLALARLSGRIGDLALLATGCLAGVAYYGAAAVVTSPEALLALQPLNAWFFACVAGVGLSLFQQVIPRPGLASGLYTNTRRLGAIVSGPLIGLGSISALGYRGVFAACAVLTVLALGAVWAAGRAWQPSTPAPAAAGA